MDPDILLILLQDGVVNGAIYALLALSLVLVFAVTRVIFIPQGELVAFGALTYAALSEGRVPGSLWLMVALGIVAFSIGLAAIRHKLGPAAVLELAIETLLLPGLVATATLFIAPHKPGVPLAVLLTFAVVTPMAPFLYRIAFQPLAEASVLVLLIASLGVHLAMVGLGLVFFGPEGYRAPGFSDAHIAAGPLDIPGQSIWIVGATVALMAGLALFFNRTLAGKALQATAINRLGARLVGIGTASSGRIAFFMAGAIGTLSGILIAPLTTVYYDSGFLIGLKGFVAAIIGGLVSYPLAALAAILVGCVESLASFYASSFKEVIVFTVIIPVLLWRSLRAPAEEE
jgi:branched-chain amino acid transport system permease protein